MSNAALNPSCCSYGALKRATRGIGQFYDKALSPSGINATQYNALAAIRRLNAPTQSELANDLVMDLSALGHTLKPLIRDGWVSVERDADDGRKRRIVLTAEGDECLDRAFSHWEKAQQEFDTALGATISDGLRQLLDHLVSGTFADALSAARAKRPLKRNAAAKRSPSTRGK